MGSQEAGFLEVCLALVGSGLALVGSQEAGFLEVCLALVGSQEAGFLEVCLSLVGSQEAGFLEVCLALVGSHETGILQVCRSLVSLPSPADCQVTSFEGFPQDLNLACQGVYLLVSVLEPSTTYAFSFPVICPLLLSRHVVV